MTKGMLCCCRYNGSRPITGIQCGLGQNAALGTDRWNTAWRGPYLGVGPRNRTNWQPFQALDFVTPPFPGYVSGHAAFSASAAEVNEVCCWVWRV